jgi:cation diffusion facilitator family transporter
MPIDDDRNSASSTATPPPDPRSEFASGTARYRGDPVHAKSDVRAAQVAVVVSVTLLAVKFAAYVLTGSAAIFSDALESVVNVAAAMMAVWALAVAHRPPDASHPYGHGKAEFISAALEGGMILLAAVAAAAKAMDVLLFRDAGAGLARLGIGLLLMVAALIANGMTGAVLIRQGKRNGSLALETDGRHLLADALTSVVAIAALGLVWVGGPAWLDPAGALVVSVWIVVVGLRLVRRSVAGLMDETDVGDDRLLREILDRHVGPHPTAQPVICSYHKLRHRHVGRYHWVDFHIKLPVDWNIRRAHETASAIEYEIETALGTGNATAHVEPCDGAECARCR